MLKFLNLKVQGFCSIVDNFQLNLDQGCVVLIKGANGHGKSTLFSALVWALYGKNLKGVSDVNTLKSIRPSDYKGTLVEVFFQKDNSIFKVVRCQNCSITLDDGVKGKDRLLLYKDGELLDIKGKVNIQDAINKELGLSYSLFMNSIMFGQGMKRLIQESTADKKAIFEEIFSLNFINMAKSIALDEKETLVDSIRDIDRDINRLTAEIDSNVQAYNDLKSMEDNFYESIRAEKAELEKDRKMLTLRLIDVKKGFSDDIELQLLAKEKSRLKSIVILEDKLKEARKVSNIPLSEVIDNVYNMIRNKSYKEALKWLKYLKKAITSIDDIRDSLSSEKESLDSIRSSIREISVLKKKADDICDDINLVDRQIENLSKKKPNKVSRGYKEKIAKLRTELSRLSGVRADLGSKLSNYDWVINDPLGNNGIKAYLFDSSLNMVNDALSRYSNILGFNIEFSIDLSTARKEFITLIERDGYILEYDELSGGERQVCNIAMALAMNEALTASKGINIAFLDEVFESLSHDNIELVISLLNTIFDGKTLFLITHHDSLTLSRSKVMQVEKVNGCSNYKVL